MEGNRVEKDSYTFVLTDFCSEDQRQVFVLHKRDGRMEKLGPYLWGEEIEVTEAPRWHEPDSEWDLRKSYVLAVQFNDEEVERAFDELSKRENESPFADTSPFLEVREFYRSVLGELHEWYFRYGFDFPDHPKIRPKPDATVRRRRAAKELLPHDSPIPENYKGYGGLRNFATDLKQKVEDLYPDVEERQSLTLERILRRETKGVSKEERIRAIQRWAWRIPPEES